MQASSELQRVYGPKCTYSSTHEQDGYSLVHNESVHVVLALRQDLIAIDSLIQYAAAAEVSGYQI
jgi:hypothetical protein